MKPAGVSGTVLAGVLFAVSAVANVFGAVGFASQLASETLYSVFVAVFYWVAADLLHAAVRVVLLSQPVQRLGAIRLHAEEARTFLFRIVDLAAVVGWAATTLAEIELLRPLWSALKKVLEVRLSIGAITFSPGDIVLFVVVVWVSFKLSQLIRNTLDADVYPHMRLPRGVPGAINRLTHYAVIVIGVMFAATAAGVDLTRLTFIIGALGVGIGFGLQNVVQNFVAGIILLIERPISEGDWIEVGSQQFQPVEGMGRVLGADRGPCRRAGHARIQPRPWRPARLFGSELPDFTRRGAVTAAHGFLRQGAPSRGVLR